MGEQIILGKGPISWQKSERISNRYGAVGLFTENSGNERIADKVTHYRDNIKNNIGKKGKLVCEILETRESTYIGDMFHGVYPKMPNVGDIIELGEGTLFIEGDNAIGLKPDDGRTTLWMDINKLYNVHEQTVNLYFLIDE